MRHHAIKQRLLSTIFLSALLFLCSASVRAENFSTTNVQLLYGSSFHDRFLGNNTTDGRMTTLTLEHFGTWDNGDNYFFIDFTSGQFASFTGATKGVQSQIYGEWAPRLSLSALSGHDLSSGIIKELYLAGQINQSGDGFSALMAGLSADIAIPNLSIANLSIYARKDNFNRTTWQTTAAWSLPLFSSLQLDGFMDAYGTDNRGVEIITQPQLLFDAGRLFGSAEHLYLGAEWYFARNRITTSSVLQGMVKWTW